MLPVDEARSCPMRLASATGLAIADDHKNADDPEIADDMESETW